jgi:hypothetical protein
MFDLEAYAVVLPDERADTQLPHQRRPRLATPLGGDRCGADGRDDPPRVTVGTLSIRLIPSADARVYKNLRPVYALFMPS